MGRVFKSEGKTFEEAIDKIKISNGARALSVITIEKDGVIKEKILNARQTNGLFGQGSLSLKAIHFKSVKWLQYSLLININYKIPHSQLIIIYLNLILPNNSTKLELQTGMHSDF